MTSDEFKPYPGNRLVKKINDIYVIKPSDIDKTMPLFCECCDLMMRTKDDEEAWEKFQCCDLCMREWAIPKYNLWSTGWRPNLDEIEEIISNKNLFTINIET